MTATLFAKRDQLQSGAEPREPALQHALIAWLSLTTVVLLFAVPSGLLAVLGINHSGTTGAIASKIHPATYLAIFTLMLVILGRRNPASFFISATIRQPGVVVFLITSALLAAYIVMDQRRGIANVFDTYLVAIAMFFIMVELRQRDLARVEKFVHLVFAANAGLALIEYAVGVRLFPASFDGVTFEWDTRSTGLLGHPLENAQMTGVYIMVLLCGGGAIMPVLLRAPAVLLQLLALIPFGGRSALLLTVVMITLWLFPRLVGGLRGGRLHLLALATIALLTPILALLGGLFALGGFFDLMLDRFANDGGSANSRVAMFDIFDALSWRDILIGPNADVIASLRTTIGIEMGVENPVVRLLVYQGAIFTAFLIVGFTLFMISIAKRLRYGSMMAFIFFIVVINSYESIANKTLTLAQFTVLMLVMFRTVDQQQGRGQLNTRASNRSAR